MEAKNYTAQARPIFDGLFKFEIGEIVSFALSVHNVKRENALNGQETWDANRFDHAKVNPPIPMQITGRRMDECVGGVQLVYLLAGYMRGENRVTTTVHEFELVAYDDAIAPVHEMAKMRDDGRRSK